MSKVKVLFFAADPLSAPPDEQGARLLLDEDVRRIREKVRAAGHRDALDFDFRLAARADDLIQALNETRPGVVHFSGHGGGDGLVLASPDGRGAHPVGAEALKRLFGAFRGDIRVVVLSACFSRPQAEAIADVVGCAIGTPGPISDEAAITFDASFYRGLAFGCSVAAAYEQARAAIALERFDEGECPELIVRPGVDPAGLVLVSPGTPTRNAGPPPARSTAAARWAAGISVAIGLACGSIPYGAEGGGPAGRLGLLAPPPATASAASDDTAAAAKDLYRAGNFAAAFPLFQHAAEAGDAEAMGFLGTMYLNGEGTERDPRLAILWLREAAGKRDVRAMIKLASAYERGKGVARSYRWARHWYKAAAEEKDYAPAMRGLGRMYAEGLGMRASPEKALAWYMKAAEAGLVDALVDAGRIHQEGMNGARAAKLYHVAAKRGSARATVALGKMYQDGDGVTRDYGAALAWYLKGVAAGSVEAMNNLGVLYQHGWGVEKNHGEAVLWFRRAARAGSTVAAANLVALGES